MTKAAKKKRDFRKTSKWKDFRMKLKKERKVDEITLRPLYKGFQLHHKRMAEDTYDDITDESVYAALNRQTHEAVHWIFRYYQKDPEVLTRLKKLLDEMASLN